MCGILFIEGMESETQVRNFLPSLSHRGPDDNHISVTDIGTLGFVRLAINGDLESGTQPYSFESLIGAFNGEVYNHKFLCKTHGIPDLQCDTHVILPLFEKLGEGILDALDGFYSGVIINQSTGELFCLRDHIGKKPLFFGRSESRFFLTSELKAIDQIDYFEPIPLGLSSVDLHSGKLTLIAGHSKAIIDGDLQDIFEDAIIKRLPATNQPVGVFLSGGLDSSLVAAFVAKHRPDATYFTLGTEGDRKFVQSVVNALGIENIHEVPLPGVEEIPDLIREVVKVTESFNPSIISNGLGTLILSKAVRDSGIKVVLGGEGADELFGGYHYFENPESNWKETRNQLIDDMRQTELRRLDLASMAHSIEVRCPFLDRQMRFFSDTLSFDQMYSNSHNKVILRNTFEGILPEEVLWRKKTSLDVGSGIRRLVTSYLGQTDNSERQVLKQIWESIFSMDSNHPYFSAYPVFDFAIDQRGEVHK